MTMTEDPPLMLSVSGLRGWVGESLTPEVAARFAACFANWLRHRTGHDHPHVVFGRDSRPSGEMVERAATAGLIAAGCRVTTLGIVTTPSTAIMIDHLDADGGMVATASHNPAPWNGLKALTRDGVAPPPNDANDIITRFHDRRFDLVPVEQLQSLNHDETTHRVHVDRVLKHIDAEAIRARRPKVVLESVHGAGGPATAMLMDALGVDLVHLHAQPTGQFPFPPEPTADNLTTLCDAVRQHGSDIGLAQDPDADRLAVVDNTGRYIGEEYTLALAAGHVLARTPGDAAANLSTSRMVDDIASQYGCTLHRTPVGEASVADRMRQTGAVIGGEGNGGVIWPQVGYVRDSLAAAALILEHLAAENRPLNDIIDALPRYAIVKRKIDIAPGMADAARERLADHFAHVEGARIDQQDGIRIDLPTGWLHVRPSNTEPILRIIAEADAPQTAEQLIDTARKVIDGAG